ncbi:hypothetical protein FOL47_006969 [Perkinsus chesapeaki]|uniref:Uncharacterized protein n=1 Tax=Perkinsus chesapeaki TaxID=330153 RepID=A0A7J6N3I8_PERCH|nr:hypothetical protein FOL47_006969 [Perkinsus chesapeaki]
MRDPVPGNSTTTFLTPVELASELNNKTAGKRVIQKLPTNNRHPATSSLRITYTTGTSSSRDFGRIRAEFLLGQGIDSVISRCPREVESAVRALAGWLLQVRGLRLTTMTLSFARRSSSRGDVPYWLLNVNNLHAVTSKRRCSQHLAVRQGSHWTARCASEASTDEEGTSTNLSETSEPPLAQTSAYQSYRCGSCGGSFPSLPYRVAAVALHRSGQHLQQLMSSVENIGLLLPGMCPTSINPSEDRYRLVHTCGQCYRLHLALEDLAQVTGLFSIKLGGPVKKGQTMAEAEPEGLGCFINTLTELAHDEARKKAERISTPTAVDFLPLDADLPIPLDQRNDTFNDDLCSCDGIDRDDIGVNVKFRWRVMFYITKVAELNLDTIVPLGAVPRALIIRFSFLGTCYKLHTPISVGDCQAYVRALRLFWLFADDANSIQRWARKATTIQVSISLMCCKDATDGFGCMFEVPMSLCEIGLSDLSAMSPQQTNIMLELKTVSRRWCGEPPNATQRFIPPPSLRGWLCMDMPNPSIIDCHSNTTSGPPPVPLLRPVKPSAGLWVPQDWTYLGVASPLPDLWLELLTSHARVGAYQSKAPGGAGSPSPVADTQCQWNNGTAAVALLRLRVHGIQEAKVVEKASTGEDILVGLTLSEAKDETNTILGDWQKWIGEGVKLENMKMEEGIVM